MRYEPVRYGQALLEAMAQPRPHRGVRVWPLGQSGVLLQFPEATVAIDLYLSNHSEAVLPRPFDHRRMSRAPLDPSEMEDLDVIVCSHDHLDHLDVPTIHTLRDASPSSVLVLPAAAVKTAYALDWPAGRVRGTRAGDALDIAGLRIAAFAVPHDKFDQDPKLGHPYQGYVIDDGTVSVAHVGDARSHPLVAHALAAHAPDLLCLPINGRDDTRAAMGFQGNMNGSEAAQLAHDAGVRHVMPMHFDMFAQNVDADALPRFLEAAASQPELTVHTPAVGDSFVLTPVQHVEPSATH